MYSVKIIIKQVHKTVPSIVLLKLKNKINKKKIERKMNNY